MQPEFSVILNAYDATAAQRHSTMACLAAIRKFTDMPYEIIVVDNAKTAEIRDEYGVLAIDQKIEIPLTTVYDSYNIGARHAKSSIYMFIQNDVFVHERTLNKLLAYMDDYDVVFPQQVPISREDVETIYSLDDGQVAPIGQRDAGLLAISREAFEKCGGWDARFRNLLGEAAMYNRFDQHGISWTDRTNAFITHIMAGSNLQKPADLYNEEMAYDARLLKEDYGFGL